MEKGCFVAEGPNAKGYFWASWKAHTLCNLMISKKKRLWNLLRPRPFVSKPNAYATAIKIWHPLTSVRLLEVKCPPPPFPSSVPHFRPSRAWILARVGSPSRRSSDGQGRRRGSPDPGGLLICRGEEGQALRDQEVERRLPLGMGYGRIGTCPLAFSVFWN
jgi:hypothetical protein